MTSKVAKKVNDAYFTPADSVKWCFDTLAELYELKDKKALEPSCGGGAFIKGAKDTGLRWTTNDLFPEHSEGFVADHNVDFVKDLSLFSGFDFVVGNPPFGHASMLAKKFVLCALEVSKVVAMVLPKGCRRWRFIDSLPTDVCVKFDQELPNTNFELPDGSVKKVGCTFMVFEHIPGYVREPLLNLGELPFTWEVGGFHPPEWATHGFGLLHAANRKFTVTECEGLFKGSMETFWMGLTDEEAKIFEKLSLDGVLAATQTSIPRLTWREVVTQWNKAFDGTLHIFESQSQSSMVEEF